MLAIALCTVRGVGTETRRPRTGKARGAVSPTLTLRHGDRQVRIGPVAFWIVVGTLVMMAGWSLVTATYFAFQDDVLARMVTRQAEMQYAYEDRLAEMRAQVDRVTSRQLLDQEQLEQRVEQIVRRQSVLEQRATALGNIGDAGATGAVRGGTRNAPTAPTISPKPLSMLAPASFETNALDNASRALRISPGNMQGELARVAELLDRIEGRQTNTLAAMEENYEAKARRMRALFATLGIDPGKTVEGAVGGPFVAYRPAVNSGSFDKQLYRINIARAQVDRLTATLGKVPLRKPIEGEIDTSSSFGVRIDPFLSKPAMHTGIDFRGETGDAVRVTAGGTVVSAGWSGGYGRMIEVDHGNGLSTRYGHLSEIDVRVGDNVKAGQAIGRVGSTGRSTGPHLHYETRIDGEAVDPNRFLVAGAKFGVN